MLGAEALDLESRDPCAVEPVEFLGKFAHRAERWNGGETLEDAEQLVDGEHADGAAGRLWPKRADAGFLAGVVGDDEKG
jgi:hypothetical protein